MKDPVTHVCEERTYHAVFTKNAPTLRNFIYYKCGDRDKAADIVQDAFIKLWQNCLKVSPEKALSFLYTVANNLFLNDVAHQKVVLKYKSGNHLTHTNENPEFSLEVKQFDEKLKNALAKLSDAQREAFLLSRLDGKKYSEIAQMLSISVKAVEKRIHGALVSLRKDIKEL
ncbi:RNA polymerase sigma factor [Ascidiimonas aurantiaca]|uniref:RNA polymerase sigma factor n=1 Tax=Ascidiimonas aurantiaca TaxID=1685432 RepID=UPI0030ECD154